MPSHSSILAWRIPRMEEPGGLQFTELQSRTPLSALSRCTSVFNILRNYQTFLLQRVYHFTFPPAVYGSLNFSQYLFVFFILAVLVGISLWL